MKILILGAGKMGSFFTDLLSFDHEVGVYEIDAKRMRFLYNTQRFTELDEIGAFCPDLVINAVSLKYTLDVFRQVIPYLPKEHCILSDISSVKTGFKEFYESSGFHYVSTHPMFGPTFANLGKLSDENAIIINEGDYMAVGDKSILAVGKNIRQVIADMMDAMVDDDSEIITIYFGDEVDEEDAAAVEKMIGEKYPECEVELHDGGQPIYYYVISVE